MNKKMGIGMRIGAAGLAGLLAVGCNYGGKTGQKQQTSGTNYYPGTINGRSLPATVKNVELSGITEDDIGSYVMAQYKDQEFKDGSLAHTDGNKIKIYSSRMGAMKALMEMREQDKNGKYDLITIVQQNYDRYKKDGTLNGLR